MVPGEQYHLFNHANGWENIFMEEKNYAFFLKKLEQHILPVCNIFAYCLMPNHFHLLIEVRTGEELHQRWDLPTAKILDAKATELKVSKCFSNFFSSYTQSFNKVYKRKGSLFIPSMKSKLVQGENAVCKLIHYIHANPVHHGFVPEIANWKHSSYTLFLSDAPTIVEREEVLELFGGRDRFIEYHQQQIYLRAGY
jgi:putative transposase